MPHEIVPCDPTLADTAEFCAAYGYSMDDSANTIVVAGKADLPLYVACVVLGTTRLDVNSVVRKRLGVRKASFAGADDVRRVTGMEIGGVTPFGLHGLPIWIDSRVMQRDRIVLGGGSRDCKVVGPPALAERPPRRRGGRRSGDHRRLSVHVCVNVRVCGSRFPR